MAYNAPFPVNIYWSLAFPLVDGVVGLNHSRANATIVINRQLSFEEFYDEVCKACRVEKAVVRLKFTLVWTEYNGCRRYIILENEQTMVLLL